MWGILFPIGIPEHIKKNQKSETAEVAVEPCVSVITVLYPDTDTATRQPGYRGLIWRIITTPE